MSGKNFKRREPLFSLCGLNCGLCPMYIRGECTGCLSESPCYSGCSIVPCSVRHGNVDYCFECKEYPCRRYDDIDQYDSLISHRNQKVDLAKARDMGIEAYLREQREKGIILKQLLTEYDDGQREVFYCLAVNLLPLKELKGLLEAAGEETPLGRQERAIQMERSLHALGKKLGIELKLRPWRW